MVERGVMPVSRLVAVSALLATAPIVGIVLGMATEAGGRRFDKAVIGMAVKAASRCVIADQFEAGIGVVKCHVFPPDW